MSAAAAAVPSIPKRTIGAEPYAPAPHFFFRALARWLTYTEHAILGLILDSTTSCRRSKWKSHWRFQSVDKLAELTATSKANIWSALSTLEEANLIESRKIPVLGCQYRIKLRNPEAKKPDERQGLLWDVPVAVDMIQAQCPGCKAKDVALAYEDGYCPAPHSYFRDLPSRVTYAVWLVVGVILDRTVAANREDEWETIDVAKFEIDTALSRRSVMYALAEAQKLGLIGEKQSRGGAGLASSYRVYTKRFSSCPKRQPKVIPIDSRHRSAPAAKGEDTAKTVGASAAEIPTKAATNRAMELTPISIQPMLRHPACGWVGLFSSDVGADSCRSGPDSDQKARVLSGAGPPAEAKPGKKSKFDEMMDRWREKYGDQ